MKIISDSESRQILRNSIKRRILEKYAAQLKSGTTEERQKVMMQVEVDVEKELKSRKLKFHTRFWNFTFGGWIH